MNSPTFYESFLLLPPAAKEALVAALYRALLFRGWDAAGSRCHACEAIREIARIFADEGQEIEGFVVVSDYNALCETGGSGGVSEVG